MKARTLPAATRIALSAASAVAADLPSRKESRRPSSRLRRRFPGPAPYVGINVGAGIGDGIFAEPVGMTGGAFLGGAGIGYNWQWSPNWVLGVEADADYRGPINPGWNGLGFVSSSNIGYIGTFRPRVGYALDHLLIYATGGLAYGNAIAPKQYGGLFLPGFLGVRINHDDTLLPGWSVGGGLEYGLNDNWFVKAEYAPLLGCRHLLPRSDRHAYRRAYRALWRELPHQPGAAGSGRSQILRTRPK